MKNVALGGAAGLFIYAVGYLHGAGLFTAQRIAVSWFVFVSVIIWTAWQSGKHGTRQAHKRKEGQE